MKKINYKSLLYLVLIFILILNVSALTQNERTDLINKINELKDNKEYFENLLKFLEEKFNLNNEPEIVNMLKINAQNLNIDISNYPNTFGEIKKEEIPKSEIKQDSNTLKLILLLIILGLIFYIIRRFIKNKNIIKEKRGKK